MSAEAEARPDPFDALVVRRGHFRLESGLHADRWIELDALFVDPAALARSIDALALLLGPHRPTAVCGPLTGGAFVAQAVATRMGLRFYFTQRLEPTGDASQTSALYGARYALPGPLRAGASSERFALVDDIISAGSSVRATAEALTALGASIAVVGALMVLGRRAVDHFAGSGVALVSSRFEAFECREPRDCPECAAGLPLDEPG